DEDERPGDGDAGRDEGPHDTAEDRPRTGPEHARGGLECRVDAGDVTEQHQETEREMLDEEGDHHARVVVREARRLGDPQANERAPAPGVSERSTPYANGNTNMTRRYATDGSSRTASLIGPHPPPAGSPRARAGAGARALSRRPPDAGAGP